MTVWIVLIIIAAVLLFLMVLPASVSFTLIHDEDKKKAELEIAYLFIKKKIDLKGKKKESGDKKETKEKPETGFLFYRVLYSAIKDEIKALADYLLGKALVFKNIEIKTDFGFSDPAMTGIMTGTQNALFYNIIGYLHNNYRVRDFNIEVNPDFENEKFSVYANCIVKIKTVHIINTLKKVLKIFTKIKKLQRERKINNV